MPTRHGIKWVRADPSGTIYPTCQMGILEVFEALKYADFRASFRTRNPTGVDPAFLLSQHADQIVRRLIYSLGELQASLVAYAEGAGTATTAEGICHLWAAEIAVDSIAHYLGVMIDDVARAIPFVLDLAWDELVEGFSAVKNLVEKKGKFPVIRELFTDLSNPGSWWKLALERGQGLRQRLTHYPDLVIISAQQCQGDAKWTPMVSVYDMQSGPKRVDYIVTLRRLLHGLCDWLDKLDAALMNELQQRAIRDSVKWNKKHVGSTDRLLVTCNRNAKIPAEDHLYLPICDGSLTPP